jgi:hypothetical protein
LAGATLDAGTGWSSWFGDLVPEDGRGRYFAKRQRWVHLSTCLGLIVAGGALAIAEPKLGEQGGGLELRGDGHGGAGQGLASVAQ